MFKYTSTTHPLSKRASTILHQSHHNGTTPDHSRYTTAPGSTTTSTRQISFFQRVRVYTPRYKHQHDQLEEGEDQRPLLPSTNEDLELDLDPETKAAPLAKEKCKGKNPRTLTTMQALKSTKPYKVAQETCERAKETIEKTCAGGEEADAEAEMATATAEAGRDSVGKGASVFLTVWPHLW